MKTYTQLSLDSDKQAYIAGTYVSFALLQTHVIWEQPLHTQLRENMETMGKKGWYFRWWWTNISWSTRHEWDSNDDVIELLTIF